MKDGTLKIIGFAITAIGLAASLAGGIVGNARADRLIEEKVAKALAENTK